MMIKYQPAMRLSITAIASILLTSCASSSNEIAASYVSPAQYKSLNCEQLSQEMDRLNRRKTTLAADLDKKASSDEGMTAVSAILFWPAAFALGGNDAQEAEYARLKGEYDAVQQAGVEKNCRLNTSTPLQTARITNQTASGSNVSAIDYYGQAEEEVDSGTYDKNIWAKAFVDAEGDETKRKIKYIELRANQLYSQNVGFTGSSNQPEQSVSGNDVSGTYISEITSNSKWQLTRRYQNLKIKLNQKGNKIIGFDERYDTKIEATIAGDVVNFYVLAGQASGGYDIEGEWKISSDGTRLVGTWVAPNSADAAAGDWNLRKIQ